MQRNSDRMVVKEVLVDYETLTGKPFTVDACCSDEGVNSHCPVFYSPAKSFCLVMCVVSICGFVLLLRG